MRKAAETETAVLTAKELFDYLHKRVNKSQRNAAHSTNLQQPEDSVGETIGASVDQEPWHMLH